MCRAVIELNGVGLGEHPAPPDLTWEHPWLSLVQWVRQYLNPSQLHRALWSLSGATG